MDFEYIEGGVTAALGFKASGIHCGIRKNRDKKDLALLASDRPATAAAIYTKNLVIGAPCTVTKQHLENNTARAVICNSGIANTCAADGIEKANRMCELTASALGISADDVLVASTGVIGPSIDMTPIEKGMPSLVAGLSAGGHTDAAQAIMTTDTVKKEFALQFTLGGKTCTMGGMAKGSGMIAPNMATMLCFITTDAAIDGAMLKSALAEVADDTFNMVSVDGDTSTNDMTVILANGAAGNPIIDTKNEDYQTFTAALYRLCENSPRPCRRRRGGDQAARMPGIGRGNQTGCKAGCKIGNQLVIAEGGHVRRGRQLGTGALRHRLFRSRRKCAGGSGGVQLRRRKGSRL